MQKDFFFANEQIQVYLDRLDKRLSSLPKDIKQQHIDEIKSDLYETALEKWNNGVQQEEIPQVVLKQFISPEQLAKEILVEHGAQDNKKDIKKISYALSLVTGSFGGLSAPIALGYINISAMLPFLLAFILGNLLLFVNKISWTEEIIRHFGKVLGVYNWILALPFALFAIRIIRTNEIESFSLYYLIGYLLIFFVYLAIIKSYYKNKQNVMI